MTTRRLLIIAPAFPPHPSPATHRARFLARYAPDAGWEVDVLTLDAASYEEPPDLELLRLVPPTARVVRIRGLDPRLTRRIGIGDVGLRAYVPMRRYLTRALEARRPDLVFIPGGPFYTFRLGPVVRRRYGIPYVLDYTDPWVSSLAPELRTPLTKAYWARRLAEWLEPAAARGAAHIVAVSEGTTDAIRERYADIPATRFSAFPFGFEPSDFEALRAHPRPNAVWDASDGRFHLVYTGVVWAQALETVRALLQGVRHLGDHDPGVLDRLRVHFVGTSYDPHAVGGPVAPMAAEMGLDGVVTEHVRRVPYLDALSLLTQADGLLGIGGSEPHYTASKIFPCILARRPMLAVYHRASTVCDLVRRVDGTRLVTYDAERPPRACVQEIAAALRAMLDAPANPDAVRLDELAPYTAESISRRLFAIFDGIVAPDRDAPLGAAA